MQLLLRVCSVDRVRTRAGLTIGQTGQMPGASRLNIKTLFYWFFMFIGCSPRIKIVELFDYCVNIRVEETDNFGIYRCRVT